MGNPISNLPEIIDNYLQDLAQGGEVADYIDADISYGDIMAFEPSAKQSKQLEAWANEIAWAEENSENPERKIVSILRKVLKMMGR